MKSSTIVYVLLVVAISGHSHACKLTDAQKAMIKKLSDECLAKGHATPDLLQHLHEGKIANPDEQTKCFVKCFQEKMGFMVDGKYNAAAVVEKLGPLVGDDNLKATMEKCKDVKGDNDCDTAYKVNECFSSNHKFIF